MSKKDTVKKDQPKKVVQTKQEAKFLLSELKEHSKELFGVKPEVIDGVFYNQGNIEVTKSEVKRKIDSFLKKEVK